jgi:hypothetical protein
VNKTCESVVDGIDRPCRQPAQWKAQVGTRETDAQLACGRHLSPVCQAMYEAEAPRRPVLTVTAVRDVP